MAVWTYALCTLAELKAYLNISGSGSDTLLEGFVDRASQEIETKCRRKLRKRTYTDERYDGDGMSPVLKVREYPIVSVTSLYDDTGRDFEAVSLIDSDDYEIDADAGMVTRTDSVFAKGTANIKITYLAGYEDDDECLYALKTACLMLAAHHYFQSPAGKGRQGIKTERLASGQGDVTFAQEAMPKEVKDAISEYRRKGVG
jgi:uncharacterized phiE125 gp8 family phage protein